MNIIRRFPMVAFALALLSIAGFCVASESFGLLVVAGALAAISWYCTEGPRGRTLPRWVSNVLLVGAVLWAIVEWFRNPDPSELMGLVGRFTLGLTIIKLYEPKGLRDYAQLLALTAVLMTAGALQSVELGFAILLFAYVALGLVAVVMFQLHVGYERAQATRRELSRDDARLLPPVLPVAGRHPVRAFAGLVTTMLAAGLLVSGAIFVVFPRGLLARGGEGGSRSTTGFSDEVRLRDTGRISESRREVFTLAMLDPRGQPIRFPEPLRLRGAVLDSYNPLRGRWTSTRTARASYRERTTAGMGTFVPLTERTIDDRVQTYTQLVTMRSMATNVIFSSYAPISVAAAADREIIFQPQTLLLRAPTESAAGALDRYQIRVQPFASAETMRALSGDSSASNTSANFPLTAVRREAMRILAAAEIDLDAPAPEDPDEVWRRRLRIARAFSDELRGGRFLYTTDLSAFVVPRGEDPIVLFLTEFRAGHCELFASAMAALCRSVGVESRLVTGFIAIEYDEAAEHYVVRESNAHAWVEVRSGPYTWATFDPTPPDDLIAINDSRRSWVDRWRWIYDRVEFMWNNRFVGFDQATQTSIAEGVLARWLNEGREALDSAREAAARVNASFRLGPAGYIWLAMVGAVLIVALAAVVTVARRRAAVRRAVRLDRLPGRAARRLARELGFYVDALEVLRRGGHAKPEWEPPLHFAQRLAAEQPELSAAVHEVVESFYDVRFGDGSLGSDRLAALRGQIIALARMLGVRAP